MKVDPSQFSESIRRRNPEVCGYVDMPHQPLTAGPMAEKEAELHDAIIAECRANGWLYFHGSMAHKTKRTIGEPDFHILANGGRYFAIECKDKDGKESEAQQRVRMFAAKNGHTIHIVRSIEQFREVTR